MTRLSLLALCVFAVATVNLSCSKDGSTDAPTENNCTNRLDDDGNGKVDCEDPACFNEPICHPTQDRCVRQRGPLDGTGCGDIVNDLNIPLCLGGYCKWPGDVRADGKGDTLTVDYDITFVGFGDGGQDTEPQSFVARYIDPTGIDGHVYTCTELFELSGGATATQAQRSLLDDNANINMTYRYYAPFNWGTGKHFAWEDTFVARSDKPVIFFAEAWYGQRDGGKNLPSGNRASTWCKENVDVHGEKTDAGVVPVALKFSFMPPVP